MTTISMVRATVTVSARDRERTAHVRIAGEVDIAVEPALGEAIDRLIALAPHTVEVDLTLLTFCGASLANFFARAHNVVPDGATLIAHGASPAVRRVLEITGISELVSLR
jgi:anti-sigma B factor antagonist